MGSVHVRDDLVNSLFELLNLLYSVHTCKFTRDTIDLGRKNFISKSDCQNLQGSVIQPVLANLEKLEF